MSITRQQIVDAARSHVGLPYKAGGQGHSGLSCAGLLVAIGRETGYLEDDIPGFSSFNEAEPMKKWFEMYLDPVHSWDEVREGDIVATIGTGEDAQHCAVLVRKSERGLKYSYFVHALRNHGVVEGRLFGPYLAQVSGFYSLRGLTDG
jgi:cell wall-associated NlpC family hydrolase